MTPAEAAMVLTKCCSYDQRTIGKADAMAWAEVLAGLLLQDCLDAVATWYRDHRERVMPADIRAIVLSVRSARLQSGPPMDKLMAGVDPDLPGRAYCRELAARRRAVADGPGALKAVGS